MSGIKERVKNAIILDACDLFLNRSIAKVKIKDVAEKSGVGEATVYRYFSTKRNLLESCALSLQQTVFNEYFVLTGKTGGEKIEKFYYGYIKALKEHPEFYRFINEFDAMVLSEGGDLEEYSDGIELFRKQFITAYEQGVKDGTVKELQEVNVFYYSTAHALLELCKKLAIGGKVVRQDEEKNKDAEAETLVKIILSAVIA